MTARRLWGWESTKNATVDRGSVWPTVDQPVETLGMCKIVVTASLFQASFCVWQVFVQDDDIPQGLKILEP